MQTLLKYFSWVFHFHFHFMLHSHSHDTYTCWKIVNTIMTNEHTSLEKYTSHTYSKWLRKGYVWEVSWRLNEDCNILTPSSSVFSSTSFSFCWAAQPGARSAQPSAESWFSLPQTATTDSKLTELPVAPGYHCLTPTCFLWVSHLHPIQPIHSQGYTLISSTGCTCSLIDGLVGGQYVTETASLIRSPGHF